MSTTQYSATPCRAYNEGVWGRVGSDRAGALLQQPLQHRQRHGALPQRALMELLEAERGAAFGLVVLAHGKPALVSGIVSRQLAGRQFGALQFRRRLFHFL